MAAQAPPTFKLVLVGDGGTGKASVHELYEEFSLLLVELRFCCRGTI